MTCDRCGLTEYMRVDNGRQIEGVDEAQALVHDTFYAGKEYFARQGWYTSIGYDLCPACCRAEGQTPGYEETGLTPDISVVPRKDTQS